jgi:hypothetical protein
MGILPAIKIIAASLAISAMTLASLTSRAEDQPHTLTTDEAFVLMRATGHHRRAIFEHLDGLDSFSVDWVEGPKAYRVKAGVYYLEKVEPIPSNLRPFEFPKPTSVRNTFTVIAGSLTYIGDWSIRWNDAFAPTLNYHIEPKTIERVRARGNFAALPLYIAQIGQSPVRVKMGNNHLPNHLQGQAPISKADVE